MNFYIILAIYDNNQIQNTYSILRINFIYF